MNNSKDFGELLKNKNIKSTKHRISILELLELSEQPHTAEAVYFELKKKYISISLSTVYRVLEILVKYGIIVKSMNMDTNKNLYEINNQEHKHHFICLKCKKLFSLKDCPLDNYEKDLENKFGFTIAEHKLEIYGYCKNCKL